MRAEPIWNWRSHFIVGQSGYDFRLYSGLRLTLSKPAYNSDIKDLQAKLRTQAQQMKELREKNQTNPSFTNNSTTQNDSTTQNNSTNQIDSINLH
jgi:hypothetical protein